VNDTLISPLDARRDDLTAPEAAALLGRPLKLISKYARLGIIPGVYKLYRGKGRGQGARWMFKRRQLVEWWNQQTAPVPVVEQKARRRTAP
jgi:hypothetical protein